MLWILILIQVGFQDVVAEDKTEMFIDILNVEVKRFGQDKERFLTQFNEQDYQYIVDGWNSKIDRCSKGDQAWGLFLAKK